MANANYSVLLHAGTTESWRAEPEFQEAAEQALYEMAQRAGSMLASGAKSIDVAEDVVTQLEDCPLFNAGKGAVLNEKGKHELEAGIVDGFSGAYGAVAVVDAIKNPVMAARLVMDSQRHCFLVGAAAVDFASKYPLALVPNDYFTTATRFAHWKAHAGQLDDPEADLETVGAVTLDIHGHLAAAGSTGGLTYKMQGRVGDTAIMGAGLYADRDVAIVCGRGDDILRHSVASKIGVLHQTMPLGDAVKRVITDKAQRLPSACAVLALDRSGHSSVQSSGRTFLHAASTANGSAVSCSGTTIPLLPQHVFYEDRLLVAGLTRYPTTDGHVVLECRAVPELMSLQLRCFVELLRTVRHLAGYMVSRCGLACDGGSNVSLIPLHGLSKDWEPIIQEEAAFHTSFPGYLTTKNGPKLTDSQLTANQAKILKSTPLKEPYDYSFYGDESDDNLFACLVRGELPQWRVWEDKKHVAFLTPFGNTPGYTVLVPRKHLSSDIFSIDDDDYTGMVQAAYWVGELLKEAFETTRCGMFFEGFEIDYAHIKLVPVHDNHTVNGRPFTPVPAQIAFQSKYEGFLTTQFGPICADFEALTEKANFLRQALKDPTRLIAPGSWSRPDSHPLEAARSPWYTAMLTIQSSFYHSSIDFFNRRLGYQYALVPQTTDSISSPMGLGSDSEPVHIQLHNQDTFLADSMQFTLEYTLRLNLGITGAYYVGCSFRGEDHDQTHLNQFYHIECELCGDMDDGIGIAEQYITALASALLEKHDDLIEKTAGSTEHITQLLNLYNSKGRKLPRITLDEALALSEIQSTKGAWEYAVTCNPTKGRKLTRVGERILIKIFKGAVWLTHMDHLSVPFYQAFVPGSQQSKALCADLLLGPGEVLGLGERHVDVQAVKDALEMHNVPEENYGWYLDIRDEAKGGKAMLSTGWGMGMERFLCWMLGHDDVRDMAIIPRLKGMKFQP